MCADSRRFICAAAFVDQLVSGLPADFTGVLDISSTTPFADLTLLVLVGTRIALLWLSCPCEGECPGRRFRAIEGTLLKST